MPTVSQILTTQFYNKLFSTHIPPFVVDLPSPEEMAFMTKIRYGDFEVMDDYANLLNQDIFIDFLVHSYFESWSKMYTALTVDYNPIHNYDRKYSHARAKSMGTETQTTTPTGGTQVSQSGSGSSTTKTDRSVAPFDTTSLNLESSITETFSPENMHSDTTTTVIDGSNTRIETSHSTTELVNPNGGTISGDEVETITEDTSGNIGVTTSQQMIESEISLRTKYNFTWEVIRDLVKLVISGTFERRKDHETTTWIYERRF